MKNIKHTGIQHKLLRLIYETIPPTSKIRFSSKNPVFTGGILNDKQLTPQVQQMTSQDQQVTSQDQLQDLRMLYVVHVV